MIITTLKGATPSRLGLASQYIEDPTVISTAFEAGVNYYFDYGVPDEPLLSELKRQLAAQRETLMYTAGSESRDRTTLRRTLDTTLQRLNLNFIDIFFAEYFSPSDRPDEIRTALDELQTWKEKGLIRYVGASAHNRAIAAQLIQQQQCDVLMLRYNMAHRKAEDEIFPLALAAELPIVAFTCTRWGTLFNGHAEWADRPPTPAACYRFALSHPAVTIALTSPATRAQLTENLSVLPFPTLTESECDRWKAYGDLIYGDGQNAFETSYR